MEPFTLEKLLSLLLCRGISFFIIPLLILSKLSCRLPIIHLMDTSFLSLVVQEDKHVHYDPSSIAKSYVYPPPQPQFILVYFDILGK